LISLLCAKSHLNWLNNKNYSHPLLEIAMKSTLTLLTFGFASMITCSAQAADDYYSGTLYRNGGHFGSANSDVSLEQKRQEEAQEVIAGAPSNEAIEPEAAAAPVWEGTLYRNGGYFGEQNSDTRLERNP
jgi:hypothetical protein